MQKLDAARLKCDWDLEGEDDESFEEHGAVGRTSDVAAGNVLDMSKQEGQSD